MRDMYNNNPNIFNIGYLGKGKYKVSENGRKTKAYLTWCNMLKRCYDPYYINEYPSYINCYVCEEWLCFQNFAKWHEENYYKIENDFICLDKDILIKGNKVYSPDSCIFVPNRINCLFTKCDRARGKYPIGVDYKKSANKFRARCRILVNGKINRKSLGYYDTDEEAFLVYKQFKEGYIKEVADEYKDLIPKKLYEAMYSYKVEIND